jgi:DnaJ-class molecular chaperone
MRSNKIVIFCACFLFLFSPSVAHAAEIAWNDCSACHSNESRDPAAPFVDLETLDESVHSNLNCLDCHSDVHEVKHAVGEAPHQRYPAKVSCTDRCHVKGNKMGAPDFSPLDEYKDSVHGLAQRAGIEDSATCSDCHGRHNIRRKDDPESMVYRANIPRTCAICHEDMQVVVKHHIHAEQPFQEYEQSVHGRALYKAGLIEFAAVCTDCHGVHDIQPAGTPNIRPRNPETCGKCHVGIFNTYKESIHGIAAMEQGNIDAPTCTDCHGEHKISTPAEGKISSVCSQCHSEEGIMAKYDIPVDRSATYRQSFHGIATSYGSTTAANCASCHGHHDVRPPTDPKSSVNPKNLAQTCGKPECHPGISSKIASAKIHVDVNKKNSGSIYYVRQMFVWLFIGLLFVTFIWVVPDVIRRFRRRNAL